MNSNINDNTQQIFQADREEDCNNSSLDQCLAFFGVKSQTVYLGEHILYLHCLNEIPAAMALQSGSDLTGLKIWPGADLLCRFLYQRREWLQGKRVLELGAGVGLVGLFAAALGCSSVLLTDVCELSLRCLQKNIQANCVLNVDVHCCSLRWGQSSENVETKISKTYDLIIGSEVIYNQNCVEQLFETVENHLEQTNEAMFVVSHLSRFEATEKILWSRCQQHGFSIETISDIGEPCLPWSVVDEDSSGISILVLTRC